MSDFGCQRMMVWSVEHGVKGPMMSDNEAGRASTQERSTRQKRALARLLGESSSFRSAQDLFAQLRSQGERVGLTTVYNQLRALAESGEVDVFRTAEGELLYRQCQSSTHHHHLYCRSCGKTVEVEASKFEEWAEIVAKRHGFRDIEHTVEIIGLCRDCT